MQYGAIGYRKPMDKQFEVLLFKYRGSLCQRNNYPGCRVGKTSLHLCTLQNVRHNLIHRQRYVNYQPIRWLIQQIILAL